MTDSIITWWPVALVMVVEHRHCPCGEEYIVPGPRVMIRKQRHFGGYDTRRGITKLERLNGSPVSHYLPREHEHVHTEIVSCHACFEQREPFRQAELFPQHKIPDPLFEAAVAAVAVQREKDRKAGKKPIVAFQLSDF